MSKGIRQKITPLEIGESVTFNLDDVVYSTLRSYCYTLGVELNRNYSSKVDRKTRIMTITRTA